MNNNTVTVSSASELLSKYMTADALSNGNLFVKDFPTTNLYEGRIIFLEVSETTNTSEE